MNIRIQVASAVLAALAFSGMACAQDVTGAGASFPAPLYARWAADYNKATGVKINYQSVGSGAGIRQLTNQTVFFGASDGPMTDEQLAAAPGKVIHLPTVMGAVVPVYKIPNVDVSLKFNGQLLADIFLGKIRSGTTRRSPGSILASPFRIPT